MGTQEPPNWFTGQQPDQADPEFKKRAEELRRELPKLVHQRDKGRAGSFYPYLLVRSVLGDRGDRPINTPFWESPDIWTAAGHPADTPALPADHGGIVTAGKPNTVYAHVWNLGFAPLAGIVVEFYWCNPSLAIDGTNAQLIGGERCELAARGMQGSHLLVKCPKPWIPVVENGGHECLVVRAYGIGDPLGANDWQPWLNRHVAQRNVSVVQTLNSWSLLLGSLGVVGEAHRLELIQVGANQGEVAARIAAPEARVVAGLHTHVLAELSAGREIGLSRRDRIPAGMLAPVHALAAEGLSEPPELRRAGEAAVIDTERLLDGLTSEAEERATGRDLAGLLGAVPRLHPGAPTSAHPATGEVQVLRFANYDARGQLIGGYTVVVPG